MNLTFAETPTRPWPVADGVGVMTQVSVVEADRSKRAASLFYAFLTCGVPSQAEADSPPALMSTAAPQSGAFGIAFMQQAEHRGVNVARFCSLGNKTDTACHDLISLWAEDPGEPPTLSLPSPRLPQRRAPRRLGRTALTLRSPIRACPPRPRPQRSRCSPCTSRASSTRPSSSPSRGRW